MPWFHRISQKQPEQTQQFTGYKIVGFDKGRAFSLYSKQTISLNPGSIERNTFLGTSKQFCLDYYTGNTDIGELLLTFSYSLGDVISGDPNSPDGEVQVRFATLISHEPIPEEHRF